jgi:hypothetical protein
VEQLEQCAATGESPCSVGFRAVFATVAALANADELPGAGDEETKFGPGRAFVRRVSGRNVWILYRFDDGPDARACGAPRAA